MVTTGTEWMIDAHGCRPDALRSQAVLADLFQRVIGDLALNPVGPASWHTFPGEGGVTGVMLLSESHLTCHTFPESGFAAFNLYSCRPRPRWPWEARLADLLGAREVHVRAAARGAMVSVPD